MKMYTENIHFCWTENKFRTQLPSKSPLCVVFFLSTLLEKEDVSTAGLEHCLRLHDSDFDARASSDNGGDS